MKMETRELGRTGFRAAVLGIGDLADRSVPLAECVSTLRRAMDFGLNLIDTAPNYEEGYSEEVVGAALRGRREGMFLVDKIDELEAPVAPQVDASLTRLGLDRVDLFVFHAVSEVQQWERLSAPGGGLDQLNAIARDGKARFRGISSHHPEVLRLAIRSGLCDVAMFPVGPFADRRYVEEILPLCRQCGVGSIGFKAFGAGKLLGDTSGYNRPLEEPPQPATAAGGSGRANRPTLPRLTVAECLHYSLTVAPDVLLLGLSTPSEQDAALEAWRGFRPLGPERLAELRERAVQAVAGKGPCWWNPPA